VLIGIVIGTCDVMRSIYLEGSPSMRA